MTGKWPEQKTATLSLQQQSKVWVFPGGRECPFLSQCSHPIHIIFNRLCPESGKELAGPADKQEQALPPGLNGLAITGLQESRLAQTLLQEDHNCSQGI